MIEIVMMIQIVMIEIVMIEIVMILNHWGIAWGSGAGPGWCPLPGASPARSAGSRGGLRAPWHVRPLARGKNPSRLAAAAGDGPGAGSSWK
jgi:hypothetical protein